MTEPVVKAKEKLNKDTSYMVCAEHGGIIYFCDDGQNLRPFIEGEQLLYLSEDFIQWLIGVEGQYNYPYLCEADSDDAKKYITLHWESVLHLMTQDIIGTF